MTKKVLAIIFGIVAVIAIILLLWNFVFGGHVIEGVINKFLDRINSMWKSVTGQETLIETMATTDSETIANNW